MKSKAVFGIVHSEGEADALISALLGEGFRGDDITLLLPPGDEAARSSEPPEVRVPTGAIVGAGTGVVLGGLIGLLIGEGAVPGITVDTATSVAMLASAAVFGPLGSAVGGMLGHLSERADREVPASTEAHVVVSVSSDDSAEIEIAQQIFTSRGAEDVSVAGEDRHTATARA